MAGILTNPTAQILEVQRQVRQVLLGGERGELKFLRLAAGTGVPEESSSIRSSWSYAPAKVADSAGIEIRIAETVMKAEDLLGVAQLEIEGRSYSIVKPSPFSPSGTDRFFKILAVPFD